MKKLLPLLLISFSFGLTSPATAQSKPKKARQAFAHSAENGRGRTDKSRFRHEGRVDKNSVLDLRRGKSEKFSTAKANPPYKYPNPHK